MPRPALWTKRVGLDKVVGFDAQLYGDTYYTKNVCYEFFFEFGEGSTGKMLKFAYLEKRYV